MLSNSMVTRLSSKGQLVIPKEIRQELDLRAGTEFEIEVVEGRIVLKPLVDMDEVRHIIAEMRRLVGNENVLEDLEAEHRRDIERDHTRDRR